MRRGPFHHHHQPARLPNRLRPSTPHHPAERRLVVPYRDPGQPSPHVRVVSPGPCVTTGCTATSSSNLRRTGNCLARERAVGNEVSKNRSVISNLTLNSTREPFPRALPHRSATCMRAANGRPLPRAQPRISGPALSKLRRLRRGWRLSQVSRSARSAATRAAGSLSRRARRRVN